MMIYQDLAIGNHIYTPEKRHHNAMLAVEIGTQPIELNKTLFVLDLARSISMCKIIPKYR
jgi:hypothetical protein